MMNDHVRRSQEGYKRSYTHPDKPNVFIQVEAEYDNWVIEE